LRRPIFHLSFPVSDLDRALTFYTDVLGGVTGRHDVALFGAQLTLQAQPQDVLDPMPRSRHFGATLDWQSWEALTGGLTNFLEGPHIDHAGTDREQGKAMVADPDGNFIELKAYRQPKAVLGELAA
jgi:extradiol dioxygenase family protein